MPSASELSGSAASATGLLFLAVAAALPLAAAWIVALAAVFLLAKRVRAHAEGTALAAGLGLAAAALLAVALAFESRWAEPSTAVGDAIAASHRQLWSELGAAAERARGSVDALDPGSGSIRQFAALAAESARGAGDPSLLLFDSDGELVAWSGRGLLHDPSLAAVRERRLGFEQSAGSATLWAAQPLIGPATQGWVVVVGSSFDRAGTLPLVRRDRDRFAALAWRLTSVGIGNAPATLVVEQAARREGAWPGSRVARVARWLLTLALLAWAVVRRRSRLQSERWAAPTAEEGLAVALAFGAGALTAGLPPWLALALAGAAGAALGALAPLDTGQRRGGLRIASGVAAALVAPAVAGIALFRPESWQGAAEELISDPTALGFRLTAVLITFAVLAWSFAAAPRRSLGWLAATGALAIGGAAIGAAPALAFALLGAAGFAAWLGLAAGRRSVATRLGVTAVVATFVAGAALAVGDQLRLQRAAVARLETLLPPHSRDTNALVPEIEAALRRQVMPLLAELGREAAPPSDLAFALWSRSPLARRDALSALSIGRSGQTPSLFSYGLPIDARGVLDLAPARWIELDPEPWRERRIGGELGAGDDDAHESGTWRIRWDLVPRPGFSTTSAAMSDLARGLLRGGAAREEALDLGPGARSSIYGREGTALAPDWSAGTPDFSEAWSAAVGTRVRTPRGRTWVIGARRDQIAAAIFLPGAPSVAGVERAATAATSALLALLAIGFVFALAIARPSGLRSGLERALRSYSHRLLLLVTALLLIPTLLLSGFLIDTLERRLESEQESRAQDAMRSAQRILGEYVLTLDPGFGVDTALDDRLCEWLARVVRHDVILYWGSEIYASSKRELFTAGVLPRRIPGEVWERLALGGESIARRQARAGGAEYLELYAALEVPGVSRAESRLVLALPLLAQQEDLAVEVARLRRRVLLGALALFALLAATGSTLARRFTRPIQAIVAGTRRIAEGAPELGVRPDEPELEELALAIDRMAARIAEARERLTAEKNLVDRIVENVTAAVVGLDPEGLVLLASRFARERLGATPGDSFSASLRARGEGELAAALAGPAGRPHAVVVPRAGRDDGRDWTLVRIALPGAGAPAELVVIEDVSDVARAQRLEAWAEMARMIAHEIKNPLTPIRLSTEHLREAWSRDRAHFEQVFDRCTVNILAQVEELRRTASEFSHYSEIPRIERTAGDLTEIVDEVVSAYRTAPPPGIEIRWQAPVEPLHGAFDRRLLGRAVRNLVENAVRASGAGGLIEVEVSRRGEVGRVWVADRGPGVPEELLPRVLEPYFSTQADGTGLGLPIARRVAEEHGGTLRARNRPQGGFEVAITIPLGGS